MRSAEEIAADLTFQFDEGLHSHEYMVLVETIRAAQREAIEAAAKEAKRALGFGDTDFARDEFVAGMIRALLPPSPPSREDK